MSLMFNGDVRLDDNNGAIHIITTHQQANEISLWGRRQARGA
jgi:hypothetical protein